MEVLAGGSRLGVLHRPGRVPRGMIGGVVRNGHAECGEGSGVGGSGGRS